MRLIVRTNLMDTSVVEYYDELKNDSLCGDILSEFVSDKDGYLWTFEYSGSSQQKRIQGRFDKNIEMTDLDYEVSFFGNHNCFRIEKECESGEYLIDGKRVRTHKRIVVFEMLFLLKRYSIENNTVIYNPLSGGFHDLNIRFFENKAAVLSPELCYINHENRRIKAIEFPRDFSRIVKQ